MHGPALAPPGIRRAFDCESTNKWTESGMDLGQAGIIHDAGDLTLEDDPRQDPSGRTAMVAAKFMKELMGRMLVIHSSAF